MNERLVNTNLYTYFKKAKDNQKGEACLSTWNPHTTVVVGVWGTVQVWTGAD